MAAEYTYEYGKRWNVKTPRYAINRKMARVHVGTSEEEIRHMIETAIEKSSDQSEFTAAIKRECLRYALLCHKRNRDLYARVMRGRL